MDITVRCFAAARELTGAETVTLSLREAATVEDLQHALFARYPALQTLRVRFAVNLRYAAPQDTLHAGDDVACIPPVGGG